MDEVRRWLGEKTGEEMKLNPCKCGDIDPYYCEEHTVCCNSLSCNRAVSGNTPKDAGRMWNLANSPKTEWQQTSFVTYPQSKDKKVKK